MFTQFNVFEKIIRIVIFMVCVYLILTYISKEELTQANKINLMVTITIVFLFYEAYYPSVKVELDKSFRPII